MFVVVEMAPLQTRVFVIIAWITQVMGRIYSVRASTFIKTAN